MIDVMESWNEIQKLSDAEVTERFNRDAGTLGVGAGFWRDELLRRYTERAERRITLLTVANLIVAIIAAVAAVAAIANC